MTIKTTLAASAPVLAETCGDFEGTLESPVLNRFADAATAALEAYRKENPDPAPGQDVPFPIDCTAEETTELLETLDHIFMDPPSPYRDILEKRYGYREMRRRQGILYTFCFDLRKQFQF